MTKPKYRSAFARRSRALESYVRSFRHWDLGIHSSFDLRICHSFVIRHSGFVIIYYITPSSFPVFLKDFQGKVKLLVSMGGHEAGPDQCLVRRNSRRNLPDLRISRHQKIFLIMKAFSISPIIRGIIGVSLVQVSYPISLKLFRIL